MSITGNISFRTLILGRIEEFVASTDITPLVNAQALAQIVVAVSNYTEEGKSFSPAVYITTNLDELLSFLPGSSRIKIGELEISESAPSVALKRCAPLAADGWAIYINCSPDKVAYGVFRDSMLPLNIPMDRALLGAGSGNSRVLRVQQSAPSCVEIENHCGDKHTIFLSDKKESEPSPRRFVSDLADAICSDLGTSVRDSARTLIEKSLTNGLGESHGALVAVTNQATAPEFLKKDGLLLDQPLDFGELVKTALSGNPDDQMRLISYSKVLEGMFGCDGIVVFNRRAALIGYNCFVKSSGDKPPAAGGARKRAFSALDAKLGKGLYAIFIRSQDGWSNFKRK